MTAFTSRWRVLFFVLSFSLSAERYCLAADNQDRDAPKFDINAYKIEHNTLLSDADLDAAVYPFMGPQRTYKDVESARTALETLYHARGFVTVAIFIPEQTVASGVVRLQVLEQKIDKLVVTGNTRTSAAKITSQAPSLAPGAVPNMSDVSRDIYALNQLGDRRVTPNLEAGATPDTINATLKVEERVPLHANVELNNRAGPNTSRLRSIASANYSDMWGRGDTFSLSWQTAPQRTSDAKIFSGSYLAWLPDHKSQWLAYGLHTDSNISAVGDINVVGRGDIAGLRLLVPLQSKENLFQTLTVGLDRKAFKEAVTLAGSDTSNAPVTYWPFVVKYQTTKVQDNGHRAIGVSVTFGTKALGDSNEFKAKRSNARPNFIHVNIDADNEADFQNGYQFISSIRGQYTSSELISNEQFSVGGIDTVRGYFESEALGDYGVAAQFELRSPSFGEHIASSVDDARVKVFFDLGRADVLHPLAGQERSASLASAGVGVNFAIWKTFKGTCDFAMPLRVGPSTTHTKNIGAFFSIAGEF